jgi:5-methylcytosine-specific restriction endonuclease McrA
MRKNTKKKKFTRKEYRKYLLSPKWMKFRAKILKKPYYGSPNECLLCCEKEKLHVHHLTYARLGVEKPWDVCILCAKCHKRTHHKKGYASGDSAIRVMRDLFGKK